MENTLFFGQDWRIMLPLILAVAFALAFVIYLTTDTLFINAFFAITVIYVAQAFFRALFFGLGTR
ncbi:MAG: hypothetical protein AAGE61_21215 [Pseudomonadota bacterium]